MCNIENAPVSRSPKAHVSDRVQLGRTPDVTTLLGDVGLSRDSDRYRTRSARRCSPFHMPPRLGVGDELGRADGVRQSRIEAEPARASSFEFWLLPGAFATKDHCSPPCPETSQGRPEVYARSMSARNGYAGAAARGHGTPIGRIPTRRLTSPTIRLPTELVKSFATLLRRFISGQA